MVLLNTNQIIPGARRKGGIKTYIISVHKEAPVVNENDPVCEFTAGSVELDGVDFALGNLDLTGFENVLPDGTHDYKVLAVPSYEEYPDRTTAIANNVNYYVTESTLAESFVHYYLDPQLEADVAAAGGYNAISKRVTYGTATPADVTLFNRYSEALVELSDPRYTGKLIEPSGVEYILIRVTPQDNFSKDDALVGLSNEEIYLFLAQQGHVPAKWIADTVAAQSAAFDAILNKVKRAFAYTSLADAQNNVNGTEIRLFEDPTDDLATPVDLDGNAIAGATHIGLYEYQQPTVMSRGHEGNKDNIVDIYTKREDASLGRVNPLYMARDIEPARVSAGKGMPYNALTKYADPLVVAELNVTVVAGVSIALNTAVADTGQLLDLV